MNRLIFNPNKDIIEEWTDIYLNIDQITKFQSLIDRLYVYLDVVLTHKIKFIQKERKKTEMISGEKKIILEGIYLSNKVIDIEHQDSFFAQQQKKNISERIQEIKEIKQKFLLDYEEIFQQNREMMKRDTQKQDLILNMVAKYKNPQNYKAISNSRVDFHKFFSIFQGYLSDLQTNIFRFYATYLQECGEIIQKFIHFKIESLKIKSQKFKNLKQNILKSQRKPDVSELQEDSYYDIKTLFENLFIQAHYLNKLIHYNSSVFQKIEERADSNIPLLETIRKRHKDRMRIAKISVQEVRKNVREIYISLYETTRAQRSDANRLQRFICEQVAINKSEFQQGSHKITFLNGVFFAILLVSLIGILVFRGISISTLESNSSYTIQFKIWRGASYLIFMNWLIGILLYLFAFFKINYRLVMIEGDNYVPKPQSFLFTATILSAIYLILFLVYLLKSVNIIQGYDLLNHLGYFMWLINIAFLLNPFKILNYQGRRYFISLFLKALISIFRPMTTNILCITLLMLSFVPPFNDLSFTVCNLAYNSSKDCIPQNRIASFVYAIIALIIRVGQSIRMHKQLKTNQIFSRPIHALVATFFSMNNVISSLVYNLYLTKGLLIYWIISAICATIAGINADIRGHWGLVSYQNEKYIFRTFKMFPAYVYLIFGVINAVFSVGWVFTISNNQSFASLIHPIYFIMILSYVQLTRRTMGIFFMIEDQHSKNVGNFNALLSDEMIYSTLEQRYKIMDKKSSIKQNNVSEELIGESPAIISLNEKPEVQQLNKSNEKQQAKQKLQVLQEQVAKKKIFVDQVDEFQRELTDYLKLIHNMYIRLNWEKEI